MMKLFIFILTLLLFPDYASAQKIYRTSNAKITFYSHTPVEDIEAISEKASSVLNTSTNQIAFALLNTSFTFSNSLMQEHFNEKYMESDKYPRSTFSGKINEAVNWSVNGETKVTATGKLTLHGVEKVRTIPALITVKDGKISAASEFLIKTEDHKIEIPKLVWEKIAEEIKVNILTDFLTNN